MKKLFLGLAIAAALCVSSIETKAQSTSSSVSGMTSEWSLELDTVTNAATVYMYTNTTSSWTQISVQPIITKLSGTVAGTYFIQGSLDGTNYVSNIVANDSVTATNVTTNTVVWNVGVKAYKYYRVGYTGSGTMSATIRSKFFVQNENR